MRNKFLTNTNLDSLAKDNNCDNIYGMQIVFIPGKHNCVANQYVLYIFNLRTYDVVSFVTSSHKIRFEDVEDVLFYLTEDTSKGMLVSLYASPFNTNAVVLEIVNYFKEYKQFKGRPVFGTMAFFQVYLSTALSQVSNNFKDHYTFSGAKTPDFTIEKFVYPAMYQWNSKKLEHIDKILLAYPELKSIFDDLT